MIRIEIRRCAGPADQWFALIDGLAMSVPPMPLWELLGVLQALAPRPMKGNENAKR